MSEKNMRCEEFESRLSDYLDGALPENERVQMLHHAQSCAPCGQLLSQMTEILGALEDLDRDTQMPIACQAAWRRAVRAESKAQRRTPVLRALTSVAAAFVLLISGTLFSRQLSAPVQSPAVQPASGTADFAAVNYSAEDMQYAPQTRLGGQTGGQRIVSDGALGDEPTPDVSQKPETPLQNTLAPESTLQPHRPMLAYSAQLGISTTQFDADVLNLSDLVQEFEGYEEVSSQSGETGARMLNLVIRVPAGQLDEFVEAVSNLGTITLKERRADDLSGSYRDIEGRIESLETQLSRLNELVQSAQSSDIAALSEQIAQVQSELDSLSGQRAEYDSSLNYARVTVDLSEGVAVPASANAQNAATGTGLWARMGAAFTQSVNGMGDFLQDMCVTLAQWTPYIALLIPPVLLLWGIVALIRRRKK